MYKIETRPFGYKIVFSGFIRAAEMKQWLDESKALLEKSAGNFGVFVDMRELKPLDTDAQKHMEEGQKLYKAKGMKRSVVILANPLITLQFRRIAAQTGIDKWERYLDASTSPSWEKLGVDWLQNGTEPVLQTVGAGA